MMELKSRRGAVVVILAVLALSMVGVSAIAVDFSRLWSVRNDLQTSADAAALAGAIQLTSSKIKAKADSVARAFSQKNLVMSRTDSVESIILGHWNDSTGTFAAGTADSNAIRITVSRKLSGLMMSAFGVALPRLRATATGWAEAPVSTATCLKPWAIPYQALMQAVYKYNHPSATPPYPPDSLTRPFDQVNDIAALNAMTPAQRMFTLKEGSGGNGSDGLGMPGNYQKVQMPKYSYWDGTQNVLSSPGPGGPGSYAPAVSGEFCYGVSVGDGLQVKTGNNPNQTIDALDKTQSAPYGVCESIVNNKNGSNDGDCMNASSGVGVDVISAFYTCTSGCTGMSIVYVKLLGSFTLVKAYKNKGTYGGYDYDKGELKGILNTMGETGPVGGGSTTLQRPILVK